MRLSRAIRVDTKMKAWLRDLMLCFRQAAKSSRADWWISVPPLKRLKVPSPSWLYRVSFRLANGTDADSHAEGSSKGSPSHSAALESRMPRSTFQVRPYHRLPAHCSLYVQTKHGQAKGTLWNLSLGGCRISTTVPLPVGSPVALIILFPEPVGPVLIKTASVCWTRSDDYGLRLVTLHPLEAARLKRYVTQAVSEEVHAQHPARRA